MARPTEPLLDRERVVSQALEIIDSEGLSALSMPRLARGLGVRAPSLYHHFEDRADLLGAIARRIILECPVPRQRDPEQWEQRFIDFSINMRRTVLRHPNAAPILLEFLPRDLFRARYEEAARFMEGGEVPAHVRVLILDGVETLMLGSALTHATKTPRMRNNFFGKVDSAEEASLAVAVEANPWRTAERLFAESLHAFLRGALRSQPPVSDAPQPRTRRGARTGAGATTR